MLDFGREEKVNNSPRESLWQIWSTSYDSW